jgi:hypothetical protein
LTSLKQFVSIVLIGLLAFAGSLSVMHQLEEQENHCDSEQTHVCIPDSHHHCSMCDTLLSFGFIIDTHTDLPVIQRARDYNTELIITVRAYSTLNYLGRAPPMIS